MSRPESPLTIGAGLPTVESEQPGDFSGALASIARRWQPIMTRRQLAAMLQVSPRTVARWGWPCTPRGVYVLEDVIAHIRKVQEGV